MLAGLSSGFDLSLVLCGIVYFVKLSWFKRINLAWKYWSLECFGNLVPFLGTDMYFDQLDQWMRHSIYS